MAMKKGLEQYGDMIVRLFKDKNRKVKTITFVVTDNCNLRCSYCYQGQKKNNRMTFETAKAFIDKLLEEANDPESLINYENASGIIIEFIGGEPLLEIDLIDKVCEYFIKELVARNSPWATRFIINISSNGVEYYNEKVQRFLIKYDGKISIGITLDGNKELHDLCRVFPDGSGSYDIVSKAAIDCRDRYNQKSTKITISPDNVKFLSSASIHMIDLGFEYIYANCVYEEGWTKEHALILYNELKLVADYIVEKKLSDKLFYSMFDDEYFKPMDEDDLNNWCGGTGEMIAIDYKGQVYPCLRYMENSLCGAQPPYIIGNTKDGIGRLKTHKQRISELNKIDRRTQSNDECFYCPIAKGCSWCSAYNYQIYGTPNKRVTYICIMHKARALANLYYFNKLFKAGGYEGPYKNYITKEIALEVIDKKELLLLEGGAYK